MSDGFSDYPNLFSPVDYNRYAPCHCGADCDHKDRFGDQPCWGEVHPLGISGDDDFGHYCEGHDPVYYGDRYKSKPER